MDPGSQDGGRSSGLGFDDFMHALARVQRRRLLAALLTHNPQDDESVALAPDEPADEEVTRPVLMKHVHLPKLDDYGLITWNRETNQVSRGPNFEAIRPLLELLDTHEDELPVEWR